MVYQEHTLIHTYIHTYIHLDLDAKMKSSVCSKWGIHIMEIICEVAAHRQYTNHSIHTYIHT